MAGDASITPVRPPKRKVTMNPTLNSIGVSKLSCPFHMVPIQLKNLIPVGTAMRKLIRAKNGSSTAPVAYMWCAHAPIDSPPMASVGLAEEPVQVLPQDRATRLRVEHVGTEP